MAYELTPQDHQVVWAFGDLVMGRVDLPGAILKRNLDAGAIYDLYILLQEAEKQSSDAIVRLGCEPRSSSAKLAAAKEARVTRIGRILCGYLQSEESFDAISSRHHLSARDRELTVALLVDRHRRIGRALRTMFDVSRANEKLDLQNSYQASAAVDVNFAERRRLARNANHVAKLKGGRGLQLRTIMKKFNLSVDDALAVVGRGRDGRPARD
ncbi:hypothetical protein [Ciceribacter thiooxidans]|uniref:Uncharacterized protein n=1 Tax=Ciceribacter thiooxidans TaxID=1969821 RepID=A0ABV7I489_9HYPH|nr:hypothetical protein [Ciceribacter thiooxidans]